MMFQEKVILKTKNLIFSIMDPSAKPKAKNRQAIENSLRLHTRGSPAAAAETV